jgi:hypothetical protein
MTEGSKFVEKGGSTPGFSLPGPGKPRRSVYCGGGLSFVHPPGPAAETGHRGKKK